MERTRALITSTFKTWWDGLTPSPPFALEYDNLEGGKGADTPAQKAWGRLTVIQGQPEPASVGTKHKRCMGTLVVQVFVPEGAGTRVSTDAAQLIAEQFDNQQLTATDGAGVITDVVFFNTGESLAGARKGYQQRQITLNFRRDTLYP